MVNENNYDEYLWLENAAADDTIGGGDGIAYKTELEVKPSNIKRFNYVKKLSKGFLDIE